MKPFAHHAAKSLDEAASLLKEYGGAARPVAGGTDLLGALKDAIHADYPQALVDIKTIPGLAGISEGPEELAIGALTPIEEVAGHEAIKRDCGLLAQAAMSVASPQIRNMGTVGGNICQEPRCWYYRYPGNHFACLRKGGKLCNALVGDHRFHSIAGPARIQATPCAGACPAGTPIPDYLALVRAGRLAEAAAMLIQVNPLAAVTGRVCPHFCEAECNRAELDSPVSVREVERMVGDYLLEHAAEYYRPPAAESGLKAAVVGSGPAGLSAAFFLRRLGHGVTVYERQEAIGGMLRYAIPAYRLPREVLNKLIQALEAMGVVFKTGVELGRDTGLDRLKAEHGVVFVAAGAWAVPDIGLDGAEHALAALDFLAQVSQGRREPPGQRVLVIGGGNVAVDAAITARRLGAASVTMACLEGRTEMPAHAWEMEQALAEGVELLSGWGPECVQIQEGEVCGLDLVRCVSVFDEQGRFAPRLDPETKKALDADAVVLAVGQRADASGLGLEAPRGLVAADPETQATSQDRVFAGGDMVSGPATVVAALAAGRRAAMAMHGFLGGQEGSEAQTNHETAFDPACLRLSPRQAPPAREPEALAVDLEDVFSLSPEQAGVEAGRCLDCGCVAVSPSDLAPALVALEARIQTTSRALPAEEFFAARPSGSTVLEPGELVTKVMIPRRPGLQGAYLKFRLRKAIDFPIAGVAVALWLENGGISRARVVLGAAAPVPLRAPEAEAVLVGHAPSPERAQAAAQAAIASLAPLPKNVYKVSVVRALVKRAVLAAAQG